MRKPNKNKMAGVNSRFANVSESEILRIQEHAVPENTKKATKFGMKVFRGKRKLNILQTSVLPFITLDAMNTLDELRGKLNRFLMVSF